MRDPRAEIVASFGALAPVRATALDALRGERIAEACLAARHVAQAAPTEEEPFRLLLLASARAPGGAMGDGSAGCLTREHGDALAAWAAGEPSRAESWRGARAEWVASRGDPAAADALLAERGHDGSRMRVALAIGDGARASDAAEGALLADSGDALACRLVAALALDAGDAAQAIEVAACGGTASPVLERVRAEAYDAAGAHEAAIACYLAMGAPTHAAAILYQELPARRAEANALLADGGPAEALHRGWLALLDGRPPLLDGLDDSPPADLLRALADPASSDVLSRLAPDDPVAAVVRARVAATRGDARGVDAALAPALIADPASEPLHRARVALRLQIGGDVRGALAEWGAQDPDHVRLRGARDGRHRPWIAIAPWSWDDLARVTRDPRARADAPMGSDVVGAAYRAAVRRPATTDRLDALEELYRSDSRLRGVIAERWALASAETPDASTGLRPAATWMGP